MKKVPSQAKKTANKAITTVDGYKKLLAESGKEIKKVSTDGDFFDLPIIDKNNYLHKFPFVQLTPKNQKLPPFAYASSGSSGVPTFWFLGDEQEEYGAIAHEKIFRDFWGITKKQKTLVIVTFSMGVWVAGNYTKASVRGISRRGYNITVVTPGIDKDDFMEIVKKIVPEYENIIFCGYPPFLMDLLQEVERQKINLKDKNMFALTAGDKFTEDWRDRFLKIIHKSHHPSAVIGVYGSADAVIMGFETPSSILIRREAAKNKSLFNDIFGDEQFLPNISQFDPRHIFIENIDNELIITTDSSVPLVRYNIHDRGTVFSSKDMVQILKKNKISNKNIQLSSKYPFVVVKGRTDVATTFYALNIYPEHIRAGVEDKEISSFLSGNFFVYHKDVDNSHSQNLYVELELAEGVKETRDVYKKVTERIFQNLIKLNIEYRKLYSSMGKKVFPQIVLHPHNTKDFSCPDSAGVLNIKGRKPKKIIH